MGEPLSITTLPLQSLYLNQQLIGAQHPEKASHSTASVPNKDTLKATCQQLESIFLSFLLKEMRATINRSGFISGGTAEDIFTSMMDAEMTKAVATRGGIGLTELLMQQLGGELAEQDGRDQ
ncbi:MAG: rod-binding protein [Desulfobacteraceae bacterium]|jgi:flagellar protein FlgJ